MKATKTIKSTRIVMGIWIFVIVGVILFSIHVKGTFWGSLMWKDIVSTYGAQNIECYNEQDNIYENIFLSKVNSLEELCQNADFIVQVTASEERYCYESDSKVKVKVKEVYQGEKGIQGKDIWVYEPSSARADGESIILYQGYCFMKQEEDYILFLKKLKYQDAYVLCSAIYGKYALNQEEKIISQEEMANGYITYEQIENDSMIFTDETVMKKYLALKESIIKNYCFNN